MALGCENSLADIFPDDVYFVVGVAEDKVNNGVPTLDGQSSFTIPSFIGWKVRLTRGGSPIFNRPIANSYFDYSGITGEFTVSQPLVDEEQIICQAYKPIS